MLCEASAPTNFSTIAASFGVGKPVATSRRLRVIFVTFTNLRTAGGTETFLLNIVRHAPTDRFEVVVVQTDWVDGAGRSDDDVRRLLGRAALFTLHSYRKTLDPDKTLSMVSNPGVRDAVRGLVRPWLKLLLSLRVERLSATLRNLVGPADIYYLIDNDDAWHIPKPSGAVILGSTHCDNLGSSLTRFSLLRNSGLVGLVTRLVYLGSRLGYLRIDGFHITNPRLELGRVVHRPSDFTLVLGIDTTVFNPMGFVPRDGTTRFLFVGRLEKEKGLDLLLDAWVQAAMPTWELHIVGDGPLLGRARLLSDQTEGVVLHGRLTTDELAALYRRSDILLVPSASESYGLVVLEGICSGVRVLASTSLKDTFAEFQRGNIVMFCPPTVNDWARCLRQAGSLSRRDLEEVSRTFARLSAKYSWKEIAVQFYAQLEVAVGKSMPFRLAASSSGNT